MLYFLYEWLKSDPDFARYVNILQYITARGGGAFVTAFALSLLVGRRVIRILLALKMGQPIRGSDIVHKLHELHSAKAGTPTMGGVLILGTLIFSTLLWARWDNPNVWLCVVVATYLGLVGFYDDYKKVVMKNSDGLSARMKLTLQLILALAVASYVLIYKVANPVKLEAFSHIYVPGAKGNILPDFGKYGGIITTMILFVLYCFMIIGASNAVNLTDGLDGLAIGCTISTAGAFGVLNYITSHKVYSAYLYLPHLPEAGEVAIFCAALCGAGMGFLWFNAHPARIFMGDTGSLSIGGILGAVAITCKQELLLPIIGFVFVMEIMSVIIQVISFKLFKRRVFAMSPIHHHFELRGWQENKVIVRFWIVSLICAIIGLATLKL